MSESKTAASSFPEPGAMLPVDAGLAAAQRGRFAFLFQLFDDFFHMQVPFGQAAGRCARIFSSTSRAASRILVPGP